MRLLVVSELIRHFLLKGLMTIKCGRYHHITDGINDGPINEHVNKNCDADTAAIHYSLNKIMGLKLFKIDCSTFSVSEQIL